MSSKRIKSAGQRRAKGRADRPRRTAGNKRAHVAAPQPERRPKPGGQPRPILRIGGLQADRSAKTIRNHRLRGDERAILEGHPAALQRIGLDRIDRPLRASTFEHKSRKCREGDRPASGTNAWIGESERNEVAQMRMPEKPAVQKLAVPRSAATLRPARPPAIAASPMNPASWRRTSPRICRGRRRGKSNFEIAHSFGPQNFPIAFYRQLTSPHRRSYRLPESGAVR